MNKAVPIHYAEMLDRDRLTSVLSAGSLAWEDVYGRQPGLRCVYGDSDRCGLVEVLRLDTDVVLALSDIRQFVTRSERQIIGDGGWMHMQFRLKGSGTEQLGDDGQVRDMPDSVCTVTSYSDNLAVDRHYTGPTHRSVCIFMRPAMMERFFRVSHEAVPNDMRWLVEGVREGTRTHLAPLHPASAAAISDMLACPFESYARTAYMQGKSMELMATLLQSLAQPARRERGCGISARDVEALTAARRIMDANPCDRISLDQLAARVGVNRTKLAIGFKQVFGETVQAYWRDRRLVLARDLLRWEELTVTEAAARAGYSEIASFTRAFTTHFGMSPKQARSGRAARTIM